MTGEKENKVEYGLRNCHYALITEETEESITYDTPKRIPGAVTLAMDPSGDMVRFKADDIDYYTNSNNQGYSGTLTVARATDEFRQDVLAEEKTEKGVLIENADKQTKKFALLFEFQGDVKAIRHVLYYCTAGRPKEGSQTKDSGDPNTVDIQLTASPRPTDNNVKARTTAGADSAVYDAWYTKVYEKSSEAEMA